MALKAHINTFSGNPLDRGGDLRSDAAWLARHLSDPEALAVAMWNGQPFVEPAPEGGLRLAYLRADMARDAVGGADERLLFLGLAKSTPVFAVEFETSADPSQGALAGLGRFEELRSAAGLLPLPDAGIAATARSLFEWRRRHRFCSACGQESEIADGGWKRVCPACKTEHFPRTDPVVIMLPVKGARCALGRHGSWPKGRMSALAGYVEPGEAIEEACARELKEEAGLIALKVAYHSSQPWPWPSSLMIGLVAEVEREEAKPDGHELEEVRWFSREEARRMIEEGEFDGVRPAPPFAIAHQLLKAWAAGFGPS
jgi:NAD+ diphosphatase